MITPAPRSLRVPHDAGRAGMWTAVRLADIAQRRPDAVAHLGLRSVSPAAEDGLALAAAGVTARELRSWATVESVLEKRVVDVAAVAALALLWAGRGAGDLVDLAARTYAWLARTGRLPEVRLHHQGAGQSLLLADHTATLRSLLPSLHSLPRDVRHYLEVDLAHPGRDEPPGGRVWRSWEDLLSLRFTEQGLAPVTVAPEGQGPHLFDRLASSAPPGAAHGTLVTVVVPCWRPDAGLLTSVASITAQTHAELEILVVDDASGPEYRDVFAQVASTDPRVRVVTLDRNGGSYLARRAALEVARGTMVTTQDADDWSHPQRIEHQLAALEDHPDAPASRSLAVRAKDDLTHLWFGYRAVRDNASSLLVRRAVLDRVGTFLPIRKSADSEFAERLTSLAGDVVDTGSPLAITRLRTGSLSRGDFAYQWSHPDRISFRGTYRAWHRRLASAGPVPPTDEDMPEVPPAFARGLPTVPTGPDTVDVCLVADLSDPPGDPVTDARTAALETLLGGAGGATTSPDDRRARPVVALWHLERPLAVDLTRPEPHPRWYDLVLDRPGLHLVTRTQPRHATTLTVLDPTVLLTATAQPTAVTTDRVQVALRPEDVSTDESGLPPDLLAVSDACHHWWGSRPTWVLSPVCTADDLDLLAEAVPGLDVAAPSALPGART